MNFHVPKGTQGDPKSLLGRQLRRLRQARGWSQEELAERAGLDRTYISGCERGRRNIGIENLFRLSAALGVKPAKLIDDSEHD
jgi:transcriptional regulator with XRE-family HTH domain